MKLNASSQRLCGLRLSSLIVAASLAACGGGADSTADPTVDATAGALDTPAGGTAQALSAKSSRTPSTKSTTTKSTTTASNVSTSGTTTSSPTTAATATTTTNLAPTSTVSLPPASVTKTSVSAAIAPTRTTGVAPLAVLFDATGTAPVLASNTTDMFRQVSYSFDFGDERGLKWSVSGLPKNTQTGGPIAAHVFDVPGTYTVKVTAREPGGTTSTASVVVTVQDPAVAYAGTKTVCVSPAASYSGCPSGAQQTTALPTAWSGKRVLLHRGETFTDISFGDGNTGVQIGAYGAGANPNVASVAIGAWRPLTTNFAKDVTVMDLNITGKLMQSIGSQVLFYRNTLFSVDPGNNGGIYVGGIDYWASGDPYRSVQPSQFTQPQEIFIVENTVTSTTAGIGSGLYGDGAYMAVLGNVMGSFQTHNVRITKTHHSIIAHNELRGISSNGGFHALKLHGGGLLPWDPSWTVSTNQWATTAVVVANNTFGNSADNNAWTVAICPENDQFAEGVQQVLVVNNSFVNGVGTSQNLTFGGRYLSYQGNSISGSPFRQGLGHIGALPSNWNGPYFSQ